MKPSRQRPPQTWRRLLACCTAGLQPAGAGKLHRARAEAAPAGFKPATPQATGLRYPPLLALLLLTACAAPRRDAPVPLFNGRDLDGWVTWLVDTRHADPRDVFSVTNGLLRISGDGLGYLRTRDTFADFHLLVEYRWGATNTAWGERLGRARDAGVFLHATGPDGNSHDGRGAFMAALEVNVFGGATGDFLLIRGDAADGSLIAPRLTAEVAPERDAEGWFTWQPGGRPQTLERWGRVNWRDKSPDWRDEFGFRGPRDVERPAGAWNRLKIESRAGWVRVWLNGRPVNEACDVWPRRGHLLLQCEGSEIFFRRVELAPLPPSASRR